MLHPSLQQVQEILGNPSSVRPLGGGWLPIRQVQIWNTSLGCCGECGGRGSTGQPCASCSPEVTRIVPAQSSGAGPGPGALPHRREGARAVQAATCPGGELTWVTVAALTAATPLRSPPSSFHTLIIDNHVHILWETASAPAPCPRQDQGPTNSSVWGKKIRKKSRCLARGHFWVSHTVAGSWPCTHKLLTTTWRKASEGEREGTLLQVQRDGGRPVGGGGCLECCLSKCSTLPFPITPASLGSSFFRKCQVTLRTLHLSLPTDVLPYDAHVLGVYLACSSLLAFARMSTA